jgi:predicted RND superfamily exporter protein
LRYDENKDSYSMRLQFGLLNTNDFDNISNAFDILNEDMKIFDNYGENLVDYGITGSPFIREAQTSAATDSLRQSIPIAAVGALILLLLFTRSFYYSFVTVFPLLLIVSWLYALMYSLGFGLNFVTATIGAVSIGVGLDFSIHMTERFRQEININNDPNIAISIALKGTGLALIGAGISSIAGFIILGFAPMPLFSTYGILSAAMISFALIASISVVPSLLLIVIDIKKKLKFK